MTIQLLVLLLVVGFASAWLFRAGNKANSKRRARFVEREDLAFQEFERRYYDGVGLDSNQLQGALDDVAGALDLPSGKLRPTDRFDVELAPAAGWEIDDGAALLDKLLEKRAAKPLAAKGANIHTLDDYLRAAAASSK